MKLFKNLINNILSKGQCSNRRKVFSKEKIKVVVVGNCQSRPLAKVIESLNPTIEVTAIAIVHLLTSDQYPEYQKAFDEADLIISQLVFDNYPCEFVQTNFLKSTYGDKVLSIVNLYFTGYTPDWFYIRLPGLGPLQGPMGDYHNRGIFESWQQGEDKSVAAARLRNSEYNEKYLPEIENSLKILKEREELVDIPITDFIEENFRKTRLFFTFNHPCMLLIREYARRVLIESEIPVKQNFSSFDNRELLNKFIPLINPAVGLPSGDIVGDKHIGVAFTVDEKTLVSISNKKEYDTQELVKSFYKIYDQLSDQLGLKEYGESEK